MGKRIAFKNFAGNVTSYVRHDSTTPRQWTIADRDGRLLDDNDITADQVTVLNEIADLEPVENSMLMYIDGAWTAVTLSELSQLLMGGSI